MILCYMNFYVMYTHVTWIVFRMTFITVNLCGLSFLFTHGHYIFFCVGFSFYYERTHNKVSRDYIWTTACRGKNTCGFLFSDFLIIELHSIKLIYYRIHSSALKEGLCTCVIHRKIIVRSTGFSHVILFSKETCKFEWRKWTCVIPISFAGGNLMEFS